jgi:lipopolysaccharide export system permease protein
MNLLDRYITRHILVAGALGVVLLSVVLVLGNVFKRLLDLLVNHEVPIDYILKFVVYILPFSMIYTIPWGFLTAVLLVFGRLSAENELTALRSSGLSMLRIASPVFLIALACCAVCLWINTEVAPRAQDKMKKALFSLATSNPIAMFSSDQVIDEFPGYKIYVEKKEGTQLKNVLMYSLGANLEPLRVVYARQGELTTDLKNRRVLLKLFDTGFEQRDESDPTAYAKIRQGITMLEVVLPISLEELYEQNRRRRGLSQMTLKELMSSNASENQVRALTEVNKRFSFSLASLAFGIIAVPLAVTAHRKETSIGFLFSLVVAFSYFLFITIAESVRDNPRWHPELLIWSPNIVFMMLGAFLFWRLNRK